MSGGAASAPKPLPSSGPKSLREMPHPLATSSSEEMGPALTPSPDLLLPRSIADKPWALLTSIARAQSGSGGRTYRVPCCEGPSGTLVIALSQEGCERQDFIYCNSCGSCLQIGDLSLPNGTPVDTSSPASSSSLLNRLQLDDDLDVETRDLFVTVDDPKKHVCTMETYITYRVTTKTTRAEFDLPEYSVRRRYQDFDWLRNKLEESQPTHLIPPLPEKFVVKGVVDRFSEEFVETRRKALDKFLKRITDHPVLSFNEHFNVFLTAKDLNAYKKQGMALLSKMGESVKYVTGGYKLRSRPLEFAAIGDYLDTFSLKLGTIDRIAQRIIKEQLEYLVELREYGPVYSTWGGLEVELSEPLEGVSACIGNCCTALEELSEDMTEDFLPVLREYILYAESMKNVLKKRDQVQAEYEAKLEAVALKREDRPKVPADVEKCQDRVECFNADLKADMERWQNNKRQDFRQLLMGMADKNIQYYEKCLTAWESIIPLLQDKPETK
ncbi:sorting nexin-30 isoform X1 [Pyrgilauda ruficollis]|uniref:sorting nexin-30 isoform X1 n=1 Tax=Pyrgilauda ruficollis TaxID=221976 RepID=UPI001B874859|nr:sorting nexin-30 isoform X1 [Pyrgilauda ruficollis]